MYGLSYSPFHPNRSAEKEVSYERRVQVGRKSLEKAESVS